MLQNPIYAGWILSGGHRVRGKHEPLISESLFQDVQDRLNGKSSPHKKLNEDFPLRGVVLCSKCKRPLTAGWVKGRSERYPRYWCWTKNCKAVGISRDKLHWLFEQFLGLMGEPTEELLAELPDIAARQWETRKFRIAADARRLRNKLADQETLNQKAIRAKLNGELSPEDFDTLKRSIAQEKFRIESEISALDAERSAMEDLIKQAKTQILSLASAWQQGSINQKQELAKSLFPEGLHFSHDLCFFEPSNSIVYEMGTRILPDLKNIGAGDGI